jgi:hypothetical protein
MSSEQPVGAMRKLSAHDFEGGSLRAALLCKQKKHDLQKIMDRHNFKAYTSEDLGDLTKAVMRLVSETERFPNFPGMAWLFLRNERCGQLVNWADSLPMQRLDAKSLMSHWSSREVDVHNGCGVFGNIGGVNQLISVGVVLKCELDKIAHMIDEKDRNRTGFTSAFFAAFQTDAVVLKVSETRSITLFAKGSDGRVKPQSLSVQTLHEALTAVLGDKDLEMPPATCDAEASLDDEASTVPGTSSGARCWRSDFSDQTDDSWELLD